MKTGINIKIFSFDHWIFIFMLLLIFTGLAGIYSTGFNPQTGQSNNLYIRQFIWFAIGIILFFIILFVNYNNYFKYAEYIYLINILFLILTLVLGQTMRNTRGWLSVGGANFQFSELVKISVIFMLGKYLAVHAGRLHSLKDYFIPILIVLLPMFLILLQPDLGTALILIPILIAMLYIAGMENFYIVILFLISLISFVLPLWMSYYQIMIPDSQFFLYRLFLNSNALLFIFMLFLFVIMLFFLLHLITGRNGFRQAGFVFLVLGLSLLASVVLFHFLRNYHKKRLLVFINPEIDPLGSGYNIIQSVISIGSGKLTGQGFLKGTQTLLGFLPAQSTDFIYSALAEQFGFILSSGILVIFFFLLRRCIGIIKLAKDMFGSLTAAGIVTFLSFHLVVNLGMIMGMMPIIGLPLPFLSYGGSSLITSMVSLAVILNIKRNRFVHL